MFSTGLSSAREGRKRLSEISWAGPGLPSCRDEPSVEHNGELSFGFAPLPRRHFPFRGDISQDEVEQFDRCFIGGKMAAQANANLATMEDDSVAVRGSPPWR